jgi:hypothetical protein
MANRIEYVICRQRVAVDVDKWLKFSHDDEQHAEGHEVVGSVRGYVVDLINASVAAQCGAIVGARRDRL